MDDRSAGSLSGRLTARHNFLRFATLHFGNCVVISLIRNLGEIPTAHLLTFPELLKKQCFYRFPKSIILDERYKYLSNNAKLLYGIILDRASLSEINGLCDKDGRIQVFLTNEQACKILNIGHNTASKIFKELDDFDLIDRSKQGFGKANIIYPKIISFIPKSELTASE